VSARQQFQAYIVADPIELAGIPGYCPFVDPKGDVLLDVVSHHHFKRLAKCSLKGCGQNYYDGYLVVWRSGRISNIGHCCAEAHIGKDVWDKKVNDYRQQVALPHERAEVVTRKLRSTILRRRLESLRSLAVQLVERKVAFEICYPRLFALFARETLGDRFVVFNDVEEKIEIEDEDGKPTGKYRFEYRRIELARVDGVSCLREHAASLFGSATYAALDRVDDVTPHSETFQNLSRIRQDFDLAEQNIQRLDRWVSAAQRLFSHESEASIRQLATAGIAAEARTYSLASLQRIHSQERSQQRPPSRKERRRQRFFRSG